MASITLRLSNDVDHAVEFSAHDSASLKAGCEKAWRRYQSDTAQKEGYFEAQQSLNALRHKLAPDLDGQTRDARIAAWIERGHTPEAAETLWHNLLNNRRMQLLNAERRLADYMIPETLSLHVRPVILATRPWWNPADCVAGVQITSTLAIQRPLSAPLDWPELWDRIVRIHEHDKAISRLGEWLADTVDEARTPKTRPQPALRLVKSDPSPPM